MVSFRQKLDMEGTLPRQQLLEILSQLDDPRSDRHKKYPLLEIVFLTVSAVLSGFEDWDEIVDFGESKLEWLRRYLPYEHGIPSHDTLNRVISLLDYRVFEKCFIDWATLDLVLPNGTIINVDGKRLRGSATKQEQQLPHAQGGKSARHLVHAWCSELQCCLGQYRTESKSNEITAIPALLDLLELNGCIVTIDAMGCQKAIAEQITEQGADYLFGLKDNQEALSLGAFNAFEAASHTPTEVLQREQNHGRRETRSCQVLSATDLPPWAGGAGWKALQSIIRVHARREIISTGKIEEETRYYISSLTGSAAEFNLLIRDHWNIENQLHWSLDVLFGEDASRKRIRNVAENFSTIRKIALNLIKANPEKISVNRKRNKCALSDEYRDKMLGF